MRKPSLEKPPSLERNEADVMTQIREYNVITPLFGGGVTPGAVDPVTPIRGTEIRGHLRFWWRATQGGRFNGKIEDMKAAEDALWGAASTVDGPGPSQIPLSVEVISPGKADSPFEVVVDKRGKPQVRPRPGSVVPPYAAFPLQPPQNEAKVGMKTKAVQSGVRFILTISYPKEKAGEVAAALWAWETFGGIGARTRRGFGALQCTTIDNEATSPPNSNHIRQYIETELGRHTANGQWPEALPHLAPGIRFKVTGKQRDAIMAWQNLIKSLESFRQRRGGSKYGPSLWPEPNAIRSLTNNPTSQKQPMVEKFPRAEFGLPIIFHFPQERQLADANLIGADGYDRLASPLILRPLVCADGTVGVALILWGPTTPPGGLIIEEQKRKKQFSVQSKLTRQEAEQIPPLQGKTDILQAFLDTL